MTILLVSAVALGVACLMRAHVDYLKRARINRATTHYFRRTR